MVLATKQHIEYRDGDPLKAVVAGTNFKAYLVAQFANGFSVDEAIEQYDLSRADIYAVLAFYHDNLGAIHKRLREVDDWLCKNAVDGQSKLEEMRQRL